MFPQFGIRDHRDQRLPQRAIANKDIGATTMRVIVSECEMLTGLFVQGGVGADHGDARFLWAPDTSTLSRNEGRVRTMAA